MSLFKKNKKVDTSKQNIIDESELKFRIKETIYYLQDKEVHSYLPQVCLESIKDGYRINYLGPIDYDKEYNNQYHNWASITRKGFETIEEAKSVCKNVKVYKEKYEFKYHNL